MNSETGNGQRSFTLVSLHPRVATIFEGDSVQLICRTEGLDEHTVNIGIDKALMDELQNKTVAVDDLLVLTLIKERDEHLGELADQAKLYLEAEMKLVSWVKAWRCLAKDHLALFKNIFERSGVGNAEQLIADKEYRRLRKAWKRGDMPDAD